jgi:hypothetical protein
MAEPDLPGDADQAGQLSQSSILVKLDLQRSGSPPEDNGIPDGVGGN